MKTKHVWLVSGVLMLAAGLWFARAAWRVHHGLVTLHVRNMPLSEVLRKIERQTWKKIEAEKALDARITLNLVNKPLTYVLDRLTEQAGARWSTLYAVYNSRAALDKLETALRTDGKLEPVGWTKIAPQQPILKEPIELGALPPLGPDLDARQLPADFPHRRVVTASEDVQIKNPSGDPSTVKGSGGAAYRVPKAIRVLRKGGTDDGAVEEEVWTPEELVLETGLKTRLGTDSPGDEIPTAAAETARKVNGHWTTYFALRKSAFGMTFGGPPFRGMMRRGPGPEVHGNNAPDLQMESSPPPDFEAAAKQERNNVFERLTPEQRVRRARELQTRTEN